MISRIRGRVLERDLERVEILTPGGLVYEVMVPLTVLERMPREGEEVELRTAHVVREDSATLYGFLDPRERELFARLLDASGVGPGLAVAMLSAFSARRLARALMEGDIVALKQVSGVGKKKAERIVLELKDKVADLAVPADSDVAEVAGGEEAVRALLALGYSATEAERAVGKALKGGGEPESREELIRRALREM